MKTLLMKAWPLVPLLAVAFLLAACGSAGSGQQVISLAVTARWATDPWALVEWPSR